MEIPFLRFIHLAVLLCVPAVCFGQSGIYGKDRFPHFRGLSGLAGGGYGVDWRGIPSLSGPTAYSTPIAHTLGHDRLWITGGLISDNALPRIDALRTTGVVIATFGHTFGSFNVAVSNMLLSRELDQAQNLQFQYVPSEESRLIGSIGVQDWGGGAGSSGDTHPGDKRTSRSFFGVLTYRLTDGDRPCYVSAGGGSRRFGNGFANISRQLSDPLRGWVEHDGLGINFGLTYGTQCGGGSRPMQLNLLAGFVKGQYLTFGGGIGF